MGIYETDGVMGVTLPASITEQPLYSSGKMGTFYHDGSNRLRSCRWYGSF